MITRSLLSSLVLVASFGFATAASAGPAEFGRDGVPTITVVTGAGTSVSRVQSFGRDVPDTRVITTRAKNVVEGASSAAGSRFGRA